MNPKYKFSVIVPHYDQSISDEVFTSGITCLLDQTFKNFEVLIYHDGPVARPIPKIYEKLPNHKLIITDKRENNWGHGNRDRGIKSAEGEYIIHFNPDNILYSNALEEINETSEKSLKEYPCMLFYKNKIIFYDSDLSLLDKNSKVKVKGTNDIIIFPIYMIGHFRYGLQDFLGGRLLNYTNHKLLFSGDPAVKYNIDCLQLVMKTDLWLHYNGWYDKSKESDGDMYSRFVREHGARYCNKVLGEHR